MCNLFANTTPVAAMRRLFDVAPGRDGLGNFAGLPAIFPRHAAPVVRTGEDGGRDLVAMRWGFPMQQVSSRTGKPIQPKAVTNARDDRLRASPFWRDSFLRRRCLIPASAFCETAGTRPAVHHWFAMADADPDARPPFAFAGLWRRCAPVPGDPATEPYDAVTMVTTEPNTLIGTVHPDRMPAILPPEAWADWLTGAPDAAFARLAPFPAAAMRIVRRGVGLTADPGPT